MMCKGVDQASGWSQPAKSNQGARCAAGLSDGAKLVTLIAIQGGMCNVQRALWGSGGLEAKACTPKIVYARGDNTTSMD
jgi:hypothetical protein